MPADGDTLKQVDVSMVNLSSPSHTTAAGHCDGCSGIVRYASATSCMAACAYGGRWCMSNNISEKVPHEVGKSLALIDELMEE